VLRILVCGGRDFTDEVKLIEELNKHQFSLLITGVARGADMLAYNYATKNKIPIASFPANWKLYGKRAGFVRNTQMLREGKPELIIAFAGGFGTAMMCKIGENAGVRVLRVP